MPVLNIRVSPTLAVNLRWRMGHPEKPIACGLYHGDDPEAPLAPIDDPAATAGAVLAVLKKLSEERSVLLEKISALDHRAADIGMVLDGLLHLMRERGMLTTTGGPT